MTQGVDRSPTRISTTVGIGAAFVATASGALVSTAVLLPALPGVAVVFLALYRGSRRILSYGVGGLLGGATIAGIAGAPPLTLLVSVTACALTWDYGTTAISVGRQLGRRADTARLERRHVLASLVVAVVTVVVSFGTYRSVTGPHPVAAVFFLLLAGVLLVGAFR